VPAALAIEAAPAAIVSTARPAATPDGAQTLTFTADELLQRVDRLVTAHEYALAKPLAEALGEDPRHRFQSQFLLGFIAAETGDLKTAEREFRAALAIQPGATRVRLELARALQLQGKDAAASYHYRLAQRADDLPPEIRATVNSSLAALRDRKPWALNVEFALVPDSNITGGTRSPTVDIDIGGGKLPFTLGGNAVARSGLGQSARAVGTYRTGTGTHGFVTDAEISGINYKGKSVDDYGAQLAFGPDIRTKSTVAYLQGVTAFRWYGGTLATKQAGARAAVQLTRDKGDRIGFSIDARHSKSMLNRDYDGWTGGVFGTYERVVVNSFIVSGSVFARADRLRQDMYSSNEYGVSLGIGGELPRGINAGVSATVSRARFLAPMYIFSPEPRSDWRYAARAYAGIRSVRVLGFSPSVTYNYSRNDSSLQLYKSTRSRFSFALARYF
jgi:ribosomal protein L21E